MQIKFTVSLSHERRTSNKSNKLLSSVFDKQRGHVRTIERERMRESTTQPSISSR